MDKNNEKNKSIERMKILMIASIILFFLALISFIINMTTSSEEKITAKDISYIIVFSICAISFVVFLSMIIVSIKKIKKEEQENKEQPIEENESKILEESEKGSEESGE